MSSGAVTGTISKQSHKMINLLKNKYQKHHSLPKFIAPHTMYHGDIYIHDVEQVRHKFRTLKEHGADHLQILTDYDSTLTKDRHVDGRRASTSFRALQDSRFVPEIIK